MNCIDALVVGHERPDIVPSDAPTTEVKIVDTGGTMLGTMEEMEEDLGGILTTIGMMVITTTPLSITLIHKARSP